MKKKKKLLSVKELVQLPWLARISAARHGLEYDVIAQTFVEAWIRPEWRFKGLPEAESQAMLFELFLRDDVDDAIRRKDGTFLIKLAHAIERQGQPPVDPVRTWIGEKALEQANTPKHRMVLHTAAEWCSALKSETGLGLDVALFRRWAKEMELRYKPDKTGPKTARKLKRKIAN